MKKIFIASLLTLASATAACAADAPKGHWEQGANKMSVWVAAKEEKNCKYVAGWIGKGPRATYGYNYVCEK